MCTIIIEPKGINNKKQNLQNVFDNNPHGIGYGYADSKSGLLVINKFRSFDKFYKSYKKDKKKHGKTSGFLVHSRIATAGQEWGTYNVHPFKVNNDLIFAHNGTFSSSIVGNITNQDKESDTRRFNERYIKTLPISNVGQIDKVYRELYTNLCNTSKLAFLDWQGNYTLINEKLGTWYKGAWYSNKGSELDTWCMPSNSYYGQQSIYSNDWGHSACDYSGKSVKWGATEFVKVNDYYYDACSLKCADALKVDGIKYNNAKAIKNIKGNTKSNK